jgi:HD-GYP domain-containing protein (c-di-GMP phosphodiesterase class II)
VFKEGEQLVLGTLRAMSNAIEARDPYTHGHSERVAQLAYEIAVRLQLSEVACQEIYLAGILHDIGKIGIPDTVLLKPAKLTDEEFAIIKKHPEIGYRIIEGLGKLRFALPGVLHHHERWDGTGYPYRLRGDQIPLMARIIAVSDAFDAMTSNRIYKAAAEKEQAMEILRSGRGTQWDAQAVDACLSYLKESLSAENDLDSNGLRSISSSHDWRLVSRAISVLQL